MPRILTRIAGFYHRVAIVIAIALTVAGCVLQGTQLLVGFLASVFIFSTLMNRLTPLGPFQRFLLAFTICVVAAVETTLMSYALYRLGIMKVPSGVFEDVALINALWVAATTAFHILMFSLQGLYIYAMRYLASKGG